MLDLLLGPFADYGFMRRALVAVLCLSAGSAPIGVLLVLRRMSLVGDALSHAILPGAALGFVFFGLSLGAMTVGGLAAGLAVAFLAGLVSRTTPLREDASFAAFYLVSLALGVLLVSRYGSSVDVMHVLFGSILAVDRAALLLVASVASLTLVLLALFYRAFVAESFDPGFLRAVGGGSGRIHLLFLLLAVLNLVASFQALGTLMAVGLMMVPAASARFWSDSVGGQMLAAGLIAALSGVAGLVGSYHAGLPTGPAIVIAAGVGYLASLCLGPRGGWIPALLPRRHLQA